MKKSFLDRVFEIRVDNVECKNLFEKCFRYVPDSVETHERIFSIKMESGSFLIKDGAEDIFYAGSALEAYYLLESYIYYYILPNDSKTLVFHSAALKHNQTGQVILIMGRSRCGKTTIAATALRSGGYTYISEDCLGIDPHNFNVLPYPRALRYRGDRDYLEGLTNWDVACLESHSICFLIPPERVVTKNRFEPPSSVVVFPVFEENKDERLTEPRALSKGETLARLISFCINEKSFLEKDGLCRLVELSKRMTGFEITWSSPEFAIRSVESLLLKV